MATLLINNAVVDMAAKNISALSLTVSYDAPRQFVFEENCRHYSASYQNEAKVEYRNAAGTTVFLGRIKGIVKSGAPGNEAVQYSCFGLRTLAQEVKIVEQSYGIPRVAFNAEQDDEDYDAALSGMTVGEIIQWLFDNHADASAVVTKGLREAGVIAASPATGYVQAELDLLTAIPPKIALAGDNFDSAMISIMRYQKGWRFIAYPDTQVYHFVKVEDLTAATITYNYTDYVEKVQVNPNTSGRATAVKVIGPRKPTDTALKLSEGGLEESWDVAYEGDWTWDKSVTPGYEATYWRVYRRWRIVDPTKREMCAGLLQPYTGIEGLGTTKCPTFLVKRTNPDRWESVQFSADPANGYIYASNPQCEGNGGIAGMATPPTDVMLVYGYMGDPLTARWPAASFSGTAYESLDVPVTVETLLYDEDFREDAQTVDRLEVAKQLHAGASDIIYEGSADLLKLDWTYRNLGYLLNITSRTDAGVPITTGFESLKALISAVTYNFSEGDGTTTLQITTNYSAFADANLEEQLRLNQIEKDAREARIQNHRANRERYKYFCRWGWTGSNPPRTSTDALSGTLMKITERISATDYHAQPADKDGNATGDEVDVFNVGVSEWLVGDLVPVEQDMEGALVARAADLVGDDLWTQRDDTPVGYSQIKHIGPSATEATMGVGSDADGKVITQMSFDEKGHRSGGKARVLTGDLFWTEVTKPDANTLKVSHIGPSTAGHTIGGVGYLVQKLVTDLTGHIVTGDSATFDISGLAGPGLTWDVTALSVGMTTDPWLQAVVGADSTSLEHLGPQAAAYTGGDGSRYLPSVVKLDARGHGSTGDLGSYDLAGLAGAGLVWNDTAKTISLGAGGDSWIQATVNADALALAHIGPAAAAATVGGTGYVVQQIVFDATGHGRTADSASLDLAGLAGAGLTWAVSAFSVGMTTDPWLSATVNADSTSLEHLGPQAAAYTGGDGSRYLPSVVKFDARGHGSTGDLGSYDLAGLAGAGLVWNDTAKTISLGAGGDSWIQATVNADALALAHIGPAAAAATVGGTGYVVQQIVFDATGHGRTADSASLDLAGLAGAGLTWAVSAFSVGMTTDPWLSATVNADSTSLEHLGPQAAAYTGGDGSRYLPSVVKLDARGHGSTGDLGSYDLAGLAGPGIVWDDAAKTLSLGATGDELVTATVNADELEIVHAGPGAETASIGDAARYVVGMIGWDRVGHLVGVNCLSLDIGGMAGPGLVWNAGNQFSVDVQGDVWINAVVNEDSIALTHIGPDNPSATYGGDAEQKVVTELVVDATGHAVSGLGRTLTGDELWIMVTQPDANTLLVSHDGPDVVSSTFGDGSRYLPGIVNLDALGHGVSAGMASYDMASLAGPGLMWDDSNKVISLGATGDTWITATVNANQIALVHNVPGAVTIRDTTNQTGNTEFFAWRAQVYTDLAGHVWPTYGTRTGIRYWNTWYSDGLTWDPAPVYKMRVNVEAPIVTTGAKVGLSYDDTEFTLTGNMLELNKTYLAGDGLQATETNLNVHYSADTLTLDESSPRYLAVNMANMTTGAMRVSGHQFSVDYNPPIILDVQNKLSVQARNGVTIDVGGYVAANPTDGPYLLPTAIDGDGHVTSYVSKYLITA